MARIDWSRSIKANLAGARKEPFVLNKQTAETCVGILLQKMDLVEKASEHDQYLEIGQAINVFDLI